MRTLLAFLVVFGLGTTAAFAQTATITQNNNGNVADLEQVGNVTATITQTGGSKVLGLTRTSSGGFLITPDPSEAALQSGANNLVDIRQADNSELYLGTTSDNGVVMLDQSSQALAQVRQEGAGASLTGIGGGYAQSMGTIKTRQGTGAIELSQLDDSGDINVFQFSDGFAQLSQAGGGNTMYLNQNTRTRGAAAYLTQDGLGNDVNVVQTGPGFPDNPTGQMVNVLQDGNGNGAIVMQSITEAQATVSQIGHGNTATVTQQ